MDKEYHICAICPTHHYMNCGSCFGFGVYSRDDRPGEFFPVTAGEAMSTKVYRGLPLPCPECGSTVNGVPHREPKNG